MPYFEKFDNILIVNAGNKLTIDCITEFKDLILEARNLSGDKISVMAVDFSLIESIDSCGISYLVELLKETRSDGIDLKFYNLSESLEKLFTFGGLDFFFDIISKEKFTELIM